MSVFWGGRGDMWEPEGGEHREWRDLKPGDLLASGRKVWRVREVRPVPVADWDEQDSEYYRLHCGPSAASPGQLRRRRPEEGAREEDWSLRPVYLVIRPVAGGEPRHVKALPYNHRTRYVLHPHYPVCSDCGEPWPCPELDVKRELDKHAAEMARLEAIMPGCCWACGEPVTARHKAVVFDGENLLLPGARPPAFHLRQRSEGRVACLGAAMDYEERWVAAGDGRHWRLACPGRAVRHVDGHDCTSPECPGGRAFHASSTVHRFCRVDGGPAEPVPWTGAAECRRCLDAIAGGA